MLPHHKIYQSEEFVDRRTEIDRIQKFLAEKSRGVLIIEGERGAGKSSLLFTLFQMFQRQSGLQPFLISLLPYAAPEFVANENIWLNPEREFHLQDLSALLEKLTRYLQIDIIQSQNPDVQKDYLARGLAYRIEKTPPILFVDSIFECSEEIRIAIEKFILTPLLTSEKIFIILSGRGKRPSWSRPELQNAEIIPLFPLEEMYVEEQLMKMKSARARQYKEISELSGGYPLVVRVIGGSEKEPADALNEAIDIIIKETLPKTLPEGKVLDENKYIDIRSQIEKLSLVQIPYRITDVEEYLFPGDPEQRKKTNQLINILLASYIIRYEGKGYQLNKSITYPIRKWLGAKKQISMYQKYIADLGNASKKLQAAYPSAQEWYQRMLPEPASHDISVASNALRP
jgi:hypothetical protein